MSIRNTHVIYPGRFHIWHKGHKQVYEFLHDTYNTDVYITMTNVTDNVNSPFTFDERKRMISSTGISPNKIIQVKNNYNLKELDGKLPIDLLNDCVIFAVSEKDMSGEPRFNKFTKKDGSPTYLQLIPTEQSHMESAINHGYLTVVPVNRFTILGKLVESSTELRTQFISLNELDRKEFIKNLFGIYNDDIYSIMNNKLIDDNQKKNLKTKLKKLILGVLNEDSDFMSALIGSDSEFKTAISNIQKRADVLQKTTQDAAKNITLK